MKPRLIPLSLLLSLAMACGAQAQKTPSPPPSELTVVVSETMDRRAEGVTTFAAIQSAFKSVLGRRGWPVKINVERFASNNPDYAYELRVFFEGIYYETPGVLTLRTWMTLFDHGKEHDFGIVKFQINQGPIEHRDDAFEVLLKGEAEIAASKIEPILFPGLSGRKN
jgi:hypothetical protein